MITNIYLPGCRRIGIQGGRLRRPRRRAVVGSIWAGGIGIGACQELDPIAGRGPAVFGIPCSRRSDSVTWREVTPDVDATYPEVEAPLAGRWGLLPGSHPSCPRGQPWDACRYPGRTAADRQSIATHRAIHHRHHHHRESAETRVTRGRGRV